MLCTLQSTLSRDPTACSCTGAPPHRLLYLCQAAGPACAQPGPQPCWAAHGQACAGTGDLTELDLAEDLAARSRAHLVATTAAEPGGPQPRPGKLSASSGKALDHWQNSHPEAGQPGHKSRMQAGFGSTPQVHLLARRLQPGTATTC